MPLILSYLTILVAHQNAAFLQCFGNFGGPLKHAMETGNFREFHAVVGGNFLIPEREFPVALHFTYPTAPFPTNSSDESQDCPKEDSDMYMYCLSYDNILDYLTASTQ